ncbi:NADH dehydrogenase [ubiquinone] 1 alpha subcomplex subunit 6 [Orussus abietinus]|uniref:NADH dehydrogenase [ubiquinone] 1 alpha subcomplex subunit 6 n=1 Tax=Orussus abietinus TaxID=222816 RepID=UPI0006253A1B|nr:NADH dehydrogenase [ubiquinone] 1 alpha subcomplex subunit 6 [Orussus abietinus]
MASVIKSTTRQVRPILSLDKSDARRQVLKLYKAWYRQIPIIVWEFDIPRTVDQCKAKLREEFIKHRNLTDIRVIDMLIVKGQMELRETTELWKTKGQIMYLFKDTVEKKPTDFLSKFLAGQD